MSTQEKVNYKDTLNLPSTDFPMKGDGANRELGFHKLWEDKKIYENIIKKRKESNIGRFLLHDGPPYLSSDKIHIGTALNKILKDIIIKYKTLRGYYSPYMPGYDCHGLPIENAVIKKEKISKDKLSPTELRNKCKEFALKNRIGQEEKFRRLGVLGDWENSYMTLKPEFESKQLELFAEMLDKGYIYRGLKAVYWSTGCQTALAEAEIEYVDNYKSPSIYVSFPVKELSDKATKLSKLDNLKVVIWTTTPWTIPGNMAICLHEDFEYVVLKTASYGNLIVAKGLLEQFKTKIDEDVEVVETIVGKDLENTKCEHPIYKRVSPLILGDHVTLETGTGCVHTAPGHGMEDFEVGVKYGLDILSPVDHRGCYTSDAGEELKGVHVQKEGNKLIIEKLKSLGSLIKCEDYFHSYPHCWRSKTPIIFRATEQWFCSVDKFRDKALSEIDKVKWIPEIGRNRIYSMVESRSDWCISRQRTWGVPIPAFYYYEKENGEEVKKVLANKEIINHVAALVYKDGTNIWWDLDIKSLLPDKYKDMADKHDLQKENDTMDVWFDSGSTHCSVVDINADSLGGTSPVEMYLEGSDQHRGWFQSSLLTSVATKGIAPYKSVLTHGFVVDENGRKMSKSVGNVVDPEKIISRMGTDILRLWVASVDYSIDVRIGDNMIKQLSDVYRNIRNTSRFILGNLYDFNSNEDIVEYDELWSIDKYILHRLEIVKSQITTCMDDYHFFKYYQIIQNFCAVELSSFYFDLNKDRLYTSGKKSLSRRSVQTVLYRLLEAIVPMLVPVLPHLAEDIWQHLPEGLSVEVDSALMLDWTKENKNHINEDLEKEFTQILKIKDESYKALEEARQNKSIGKSIESKLIFNIKEQKSGIEDLLLRYEKELPTIFIVSQIEINKTDAKSLTSVENENYKVSVLNADGEKCPRCWKFSVEIGVDSDHPAICKECTEAVS